MIRKILTILPIIIGLVFVLTFTSVISQSAVQAKEIPTFPSVNSKAALPEPARLSVVNTPLDTLVNVLGANPVTLDPALDYETSGGLVLQQIYDPLLTYKREKTDEFVPLLATSWNISPDGKTYTFQIRRGVKFHNGNTLTPADVAYTFQRGILQGNKSSPQWLYSEALFGFGIYDVCDLIDRVYAMTGVPYRLTRLLTLHRFARSALTSPARSAPMMYPGLSHSSFSKPGDRC